MAATARHSHTHCMVDFCWCAQTKYACNGTTFQCEEAATGNYSALVSCESACKAPPPPAITYDCDLQSHTCKNAGQSGNFSTLSGCNKACTAPTVSD